MYNFHPDDLGLSGMALTEMPAIFLMTFGFLLLIWSTSTHQTKDGKETHGKNTNFVSAKQIIAAIMGGLAMGVAIAGRQPLLVTLAAVPILAIDSRSRIQVLCFLLIPFFKKDDRHRREVSS